MLKQEEVQNNHIIARLSALWALSETGLGGVMHALNLPFTGIILGGFSIAITYLIATYSNRPFRDLFRTTIIVLAIKAAVSPHSPFGAYFAVGFQGFSAALLYGWAGYSMGRKKLILPFHAILTQLMSATQKVIILTLYYGVAFWDSVDALFNKITSDLEFISNISASQWLIGIYMSMHVLTALLVTIWVLRWNRKFDATEKFEEYKPEPFDTSIKTKPKKWKYRNYIFIALMLTFVFLVQAFVLDNPERGLWVLLRSVVVIAAMYGVVLPGLKIISKRWILNKRSNLEEAVRQTESILPALRPLARYAWKKSSQKKFRLLWFFEYLLHLGITAKINDNDTTDR